MGVPGPCHYPSPVRDSISCPGLGYLGLSQQYFGTPVQLLRLLVLWINSSPDCSLSQDSPPLDLVSGGHLSVQAHPQLPTEPLEKTKVPSLTRGLMSICRSLPLLPQDQGLQMWPWTNLKGYSILWNSYLPVCPNQGRETSPPPRSPGNPFSELYFLMLK